MHDRESVMTRKPCKKTPPPCAVSATASLCSVDCETMFLYSKRGRGAWAACGPIGLFVSVQRALPRLGLCIRMQHTNRREIVIECLSRFGRED
eukprot:1400853-Prymnesium_polylepis.1